MECRPYEETWQPILHRGTNHEKCARLEIRIMVESCDNWRTGVGANHPLCGIRRCNQQCSSVSVWTRYRVHIWLGLRCDAMACFAPSGFCLVDRSDICGMGHLLDNQPC